MVLFACLGACSSGTATTDAGPIVALHGRVYAAHGAPLVFPVRINLEARRNPFEPAVAVDLDDGRRVGGVLLLVTPGTVPPTTAEEWWIGPLPTVDVELWGEAAEPASGTPYLYLNLPIDAVGQGFWLEGVRIQPVWLPNATQIADNRTPADFHPPFEPLSDDPSLTAMLDFLSRSPLTRWRSRLVRDGLRPAGLRANSTETEPRPDRFVVDAIEALAAQEEALWQVALARLWVVDRSLARRVRERLAMLANVGGRPSPAWISDEAALKQLREAFLDPRTPENSRLTRARLFIGQTPHVASWVIADPASSDERGRASLAILNLTGEGAMAWSSGSGGGMELSSCPDRDTTIIPARLSNASIDGRSSITSTVGTVEARLGSWRLRHAVAASPAPVQPPGFAMSPMYADWSMTALLQGSAFAVPGHYAGGMVAMLTRTRTPSSGEEGWSILLECTKPLSETGDAVTIWLGPAGDTRHRIEVRPDGTVRDGVSGNESSLQVMSSGNTWLCRVPIPPGAISTDGRLTIGLTRSLGDGRRCAYPRPMLPWEAEPARAVLATNSWSPIGSP